METFSFYAKTNAITSLIVISILFAAFNGLVIAWYNSNDVVMSDRLKRLWHGVGFAIRAFISLVAYFTSSLWWFGAIAFISWLPYNIIIALIIGRKWYYLGNKGIDGFIMRLFGKKQ